MNGVTDSDNDNRIVNSCNTLWTVSKKLFDTRRGDGDEHHVTSAAAACPLDHHNGYSDRRHPAAPS